MALNCDTHCNLYHHACAVKRTSVSLENIFDEAVKVTNFSKSRVFFNILSHELGSICKVLSLHTKVQQLI